MTISNSSNALVAGEILAGKYRVERILGAGSAGIVVAATHLDLEEIRAVKLLRQDLVDASSIERFLREARALVKLRSEHAVRVYDVGRLDSGAPYMVMELLQGEDLAAATKMRGPLPVEEATQYVTQACTAIGEAHGLGIVHRDLKPANLFVTRNEDGSPRVKVLDFGISKRVGDGGVEMTQHGDVMGSPLYMAPEQMRSAKQADARSDIFSLGAILYKLLTGRAPFQAPTIPEIFAAGLDAAPAPRASAIRPDIPAGLCEVLSRCLDKDPSGRPASAEELRRALLPFVTARRVEASPVDDEDPLGQTIPMTAAWHAAAYRPPARSAPAIETRPSTQTLSLQSPEIVGSQAAQLVREWEGRQGSPRQTDSPRVVTTRGTQLMPAAPNHHPSSVPPPPAPPRAPLPSFWLAPPPIPAPAPPSWAARTNPAAARISFPEIALTNALVPSNPPPGRTLARRHWAGILVAGAMAVLLLAGLISVLVRRAPDGPVTSAVEETD